METVAKVTGMRIGFIATISLNARQLEFQFNRNREKVLLK